MEDILDKAVMYLGTYAFRLIGAVIILVLGRYAASIGKKVITRVLTKIKSDVTVITFVGNLSYLLILIFAILAALASCGVETTSIVALLGACGLALGLALQGSLSNFASGVLILVLRPFKIGDFIEGAGVAGEVREIRLFITVLSTIDNIKIVVPNTKLFGDVIKNYSGYNIRRIDLVVSIGYGSPIGKAIEVLSNLAKEDVRILSDPPAQIAVSSLDVYSVNLVFRPWVKKKDYWDVRFDLMRKIKESFDQNNIEIPFPHHVVLNK